MPELITLSGVGGKTPAAFLVKSQEHSILLDIGEGPEPGVLPDFTGIDRVDAVLLSHAHVDHVGGLALLPNLGNPEVYASQATWELMPEAPVADAQRRILPVEGQINLCGTQITMGQTGHAPGGLWFHVGIGHSLLYMGDHSEESPVLPYEAPPAAHTVIVDASYGDRNTDLETQLDALENAAKGGAVIAVPIGGRGPDLVIALQARGLPVKVDEQVARELAFLTQNPHLANPHVHGDLAKAVNTPRADQDAKPSDVIIAVGPNADYGLTQSLAEATDEPFRFVFTGFVPQNSRAKRLIETGRGEWLPWNVHPRMKDVIKLVDQTGAKQVVPAFVDPNKATHLLNTLGNRICLDRAIKL